MIAELIGNDNTITSCLLVSLVECG